MEFKEKFEILMEIVEQNIKDGNAADILGRAEQETGDASYIVGDAFTYIANMNMGHYMTLRKYDEAMRLALSTEDKKSRIENAAAEFGYYDRGNFDKEVKKHFGATPAAFIRGDVVFTGRPRLTLEGLLGMQSISEKSESASTKITIEINRNPENAFAADSAVYKDIRDCQAAYGIDIPILERIQKSLKKYSRDNLIKACEAIQFSGIQEEETEPNSIDDDIFFLIANFNLHQKEAKIIARHVTEDMNITVAEIDQEYLHLIAQHNGSDMKLLDMLPYEKYLCGRMAYEYIEEIAKTDSEAAKNTGLFWKKDQLRKYRPRISANIALLFTKEEINNPSKDIEKLIMRTAGSSTYHSEVILGMKKQERMQVGVIIEEYNKMLKGTGEEKPFKVRTWEKLATFNDETPEDLTEEEYELAYWEGELEYALYYLNEECPILDEYDEVMADISWFKERIAALKCEIKRHEKGITNAEKVENRKKWRALNGIKIGSIEYLINEFFYDISEDKNAYEQLDEEECKEAAELCGIDFNNITEDQWKNHIEKTGFELHIICFALLGYKKGIFNTIHEGVEQVKKVISPVQEIVRKRWEMIQETDYYDCYETMVNPGSNLEEAFCMWTGRPKNMEEYFELPCTVAPAEVYATYKKAFENRKPESLTEAEARRIWHAAATGKAYMDVYKDGQDFSNNLQKEMKRAYGEVVRKQRTAEKIKEAELLKQQARDKAAVDNANRLKKGTKIIHKKWGEGTVESVSEKKVAITFNGDVEPKIIDLITAFEFIEII